MLTILMPLLLLFVGLAGAFLFMRRKLRFVADKHNLKADIDLEVAKMVQGDAKEAIMVGVYRKGTEYFKAEGHVSDEVEELPDQHSVFQVGSLSKLFTASILHSLIEEGVVSMDATLDALIGDQYDLADSAKAITLHQLVTHTAGFPRVPKAFVEDALARFGKENLQKDPYSILTLDDVMGYLKECEDKKPSGKFEYSNFGYGLLGHVLEHVTKKSLETLAQDMLFNPHSMSKTGITQDSIHVESMVQGHNRQAEKTGLWHYGALAGAGGFHSTASDMLGFLKTYLASNNDNTPPLTAEGGWLGAGKLERMYGNNDIVWHNGLVGGYTSYAAIDPVNDVAIIILSAKVTDLTMPGIMLMRSARTQSWSRHTAS